MSGEVAGFSCPNCRSPRPIYLIEMVMGILEEAGTPIAYELECGCCDYEWRLILGL